MNSVTTVTKEYRNAAGESIVITFINGVPTLPIPDGYTLYNAEAGGGGAVSLAGQVVAQSNTSGRGSDNRQDRDRSPVIAPEPIVPENVALPAPVIVSALIAVPAVLVLNLISPLALS